MIRILFVCMGNICRSPAAEGILRAKLTALGKVEGGDFVVGSAGTTTTHQGSGPDKRSEAVVSSHQIDISKIISRPITAEDGKDFDLILCMDKSNVVDAKRVLATEDHHKVRLLDSEEIEDPYWRNDGFELMYEHIDMAVDDLIRQNFPQK